MRLEQLKGSLCMSLTYQSTQLLNSLRIWTKHFEKKKDTMKLPNFTILPWSETRKKSPIIICKFYKPNLSGKNIMWYTTFDQNHYKKPFISSHQFIKFFLPSTLAPFLWIYPHHNTTIKTIKKIYTMYSTL